MELGRQMDSRAPPDALDGRMSYAVSRSTHAAWPATLAFDRVGPHHCGLFGRLAGNVPNFSCSPAMKRSRIVWNDKSLDRFLSSPLNAVPATR